MLKLIGKHLCKLGNLTAITILSLKVFNFNCWPLSWHFCGDLISSHLSLSPLTLTVVEAPYMVLQQYLSTFPCLLLPSGRVSKCDSYSFIDIVFPPLLLPLSPSCSFQTSSPLKPLGRLKQNFMWSLLMTEKRLLQNWICRASGSWDIALPSEFPFLHHG